MQLSGYAQGGTWSVKYNTAGVKMRPADVQKGIEAILHNIDTTLSGYNKGSQLSRLNAGDTLVPSAMLCALYARSYQFWEQTGGAVDIAAGPLFDIWGFGFKNDTLPSNTQVREAMAISGMGRLVPTMEEALLPCGRLCASRLLRSTSGSLPAIKQSAQGAGSNSPSTYLPQLNFNAIAQGFSCDTVARYLSVLGVWDMLVDIGEIYCRGLSPSGQPWKIGVDRPVDGNNSPGADLDGIWQSNGLTNAASLAAAPTVASQDSCSLLGALEKGAASKDSDLKGAYSRVVAPKGSSSKKVAFEGGESHLAGGQGIVTSGNYRKYYVRDGQKYSHTIDPRTGYPAEGKLLSATIVAPTAEEADAFATYCMVIGLESAQNFICSNPQIEGYLIFSTPNGSMSDWHSPGFSLVENI